MIKRNTIFFWYLVKGLQSMCYFSLYNYDYMRTDDVYIYTKLYVINLTIVV